MYLCIKDGQAEVRPAEHLWGQQTGPVQDAIRAELGDQRVRVAQIGPAGENQVLYAAIMHDINRAAGRNGLGAVMGSKNLKAVAVRGTSNVPVAERQPVTAVSKWAGRELQDPGGLGHHPRPRHAGLADALGLSRRAAHRELWPAGVGRAGLLSGERNYEMFLKERDTCQACPITCKQVFENETETPYQKLNPAYGGPEYEAMAALGPPAA